LPSSADKKVGRQKRRSRFNHATTKAMFGKNAPKAHTVTFWERLFYIQKQPNPPISRTNRTEQAL
jgi:hypothetical protein